MNENVARRWLNYAISDLKLAKLCINYAKEETAQICFHSQQCVEKTLKAFLVYNEVTFPKTHSIEYLQQLCKDADPDFSNIEIGNLSVYAVETRYPFGFKQPLFSDASKAYDIAKLILSFVVSKLKSDQDLTLF